MEFSWRTRSKGKDVSSGFQDPLGMTCNHVSIATKTTPRQTMIPYLSRREVPVYLEKRGLKAGIAQEPVQQSILLEASKSLLW